MYFQTVSSLGLLLLLALGIYNALTSRAILRRQRKIDMANTRNEQHLLDAAGRIESAAQTFKQGFDTVQEKYNNLLGQYSELKEKYEGLLKSQGKPPDVVEPPEDLTEEFGAFDSALNVLEQGAGFIRAAVTSGAGTGPQTGTTGTTGVATGGGPEPQSGSEETGPGGVPTSPVPKPFDPNEQENEGILITDVSKGQSEPPMSGATASGSAFGQPTGPGQESGASDAEITNEGQGDESPE
jgi:hypothetical protein